MKANQFTDTYGLVLCGGKSSRMGRDKSMLQYHQKPQRYHLYDMLLPFCEQVFISCNAMQVNTIEDGYAFIQDADSFSDIGPMAALLSAFTKFPKKNMLLAGCDYPFITLAHLAGFSANCKELPAAFYNEQAYIYEPMLAWYPASSFEKLKAMHGNNQFSLQHFLNDNKAVKYYPSNKNAIASVDTVEDFNKAVMQLGK
jgi:molybdopterin-guanine dinucleotide biosynthesis protein A